MFIKGTGKDGKAVQVSRATIEDNLRAELAKAKIAVDDRNLRYLGGMFARLHEALCLGWDVWAQLEKEPRDLDCGRHYYSIRFVNAEHTVSQVWPVEPYEDVARWMGMSINKRDMARPKYMFSSRVIGMSRKLDATGAFAELFRRVTGTYFQL
jgi:hypothetical protein